MKRSCKRCCVPADDGNFGDCCSFICLFSLENNDDEDEDDCIGGGGGGGGRGGSLGA